MGENLRGKIDFSPRYRQTSPSPANRFRASRMSRGGSRCQRGECDPGTVRPMSGNRVSYTLDSTLETVNSAEETAGRMASEAGFDDDDVMKISMAVREAAVNAVMHGNAYSP